VKIAENGQQINRKVTWTESYNKRYRPDSGKRYAPSTVTSVLCSDDHGKR